jgi:hypothetical protein
MCECNLENMDCVGVHMKGHKELYSFIIKYDKREYITNVLLVVFL